MLGVVFGGLISRKELRKLAWARLDDARVLHTAKRYDCAAYVCGYSVEFALKARICRTLRWTDFPSTQAEFAGLGSLLKIHNLSILLRLSGVEAKVKTTHLAEWSIVQGWEPEMRYEPVGKVLPKDASDMIISAETVVRVVA